ncbi:branched-chain amino acid transport system II carrier protein [Bacillus carboniphilus]|uniref:Branched-chain amino acid transport system carrier protein n=1 Tax=Bacillus carboniphilus TaxID=86663 RepID=A0ABP3FPL5_9BACI
MNTKPRSTSYLIIGVMLFALFFGAGNLIFPAQLGQHAGTNLIPAAIGFLITGVGLPLLGILAMGYSGSRNLQELSGRIHPVYGVLFTSILYLTIGPFFAAPRTGTVAFEVGIAPFVPEESQQLGLFIFTIMFFVIALLFSLNPGKLVQNVGKVLAPALVILMSILLIVAYFNPMGQIEAPQEAYQSGAFMKGFLEGYNTMDALASLVFGIIVLKTIRSMGITTRKEVISATAKSGLVAITLLGIIYFGISYLGATSTSVLGVFNTGGPVLSGAASHYFGTLGSYVLAVVIGLACLTTAIGLIVSNAEYFHTLFPRFSYRTLVVFFTLLTFIIANFGLANIIAYSIPMLMFLYPLAIVLMILTFASPIFLHARVVYVAAIFITFMISLVDGIKTLCQSLEIEYYNWLAIIIRFYENYLPLYSEGLGWFIPVVTVIIMMTILIRLLKVSFKTVDA